MLLIGVFVPPWIFPNWLTALTVFVGSVVTILGVKVCASIPAESKVNQIALGALGCSVLCFLTVIANFLPGSSMLWLVATALVLGALAHVLFAVVLHGCLSYLGHRFLTTLAKAYIGVAAVSSLLVVAFHLAGWTDRPEMWLVLKLIVVATAIFLLYLTSSASKTLRRAQQGLPVEGSGVARERATGIAAEGHHEEAGLKAPASEEVAAETPKTPHFTDAEIRVLQTEDSSAGSAIVALMAGVFIVGVILYTIIAAIAMF